MLILSKLIYRLKAILVDIQIEFLVMVSKLILKIIWNNK